MRCIVVRLELDRSLLYFTIETDVKIFCLQFLDLQPEAMEQVAAAMGADTTVEDISKTVEELARLH